MYIHNVTAEVNFSDDYGNAMKLIIVEDYMQHMGYVDKFDRMANIYSVSSCSKCTKELFISLTDLKILNSYILLASSEAKMIHRDFRHWIIYELVG